jgi:hypothetical protein
MKQYPTAMQSVMGVMDGEEEIPRNHWTSRFPEAGDVPFRILDDRDGADSVDLIFRHHDFPARSRDRFDLPARQ